MSASYKFNREQVMDAARKGARNGVNALTVSVQQEIGVQLNKHASNRSKGGKASPPGSPPGRATATLARSWGVKVRSSRPAPPPVYNLSRLNDPLRPRISLGSNLAYARIHEYGGPITGKPWLTIPFSNDAKIASARGVGARGFGNTFFRKLKTGSLGLFRSRKRGKPELMYVLKKSVTLPARPYLRPALAAVRPRAAGIVGKFMDAALRRFTRA